MRNLKQEAATIAGPGLLVRVKESKRARVSPHWGAWDVHVKIDGAKRGRCIVTLVHLNGTVFV